MMILTHRRTSAANPSQTLGINRRKTDGSDMGVTSGRWGRSSGGCHVDLAVENAMVGDR